MLLMGGVGVARPDGGPAVTFQITPCAPVIPAIKNLSFTFSPIWDGKGVLVVHTAEWEIRDLGNPRRVARIPAQEYFDKTNGMRDERLPHPDGARGGFNEDDLRHIGEVGPGSYGMALQINGARASNVIAFKIDPSMDAAKAPVVVPGMDEAPPGMDTGSLVAWIVAPTPQDPQFTDWAMEYADVLVDGELQKKPPGPFSTHYSVYKAGESSVWVYDSSDYVDVTEVSWVHAFQIKAGKYISSVAQLDLKSQALGRQWDNETNSLAPIPAPQYLLAGVVVDEKGEPAAGWRMLLRQGSSRLYYEMTNAKGEYFYSGVEPGDYALWCNPVSGDGPNMRMEQVTITPGQTRTINLSFVMTYSVSGRVTDSRGAGMKGVPMQAGWSDPGTQTVCYTEVPTQADGSYEIRGPFPNIVFVTIMNELMERSSPRHVHDAKSGATNINFRVSDN
jgi:hypothetical protein